MSRTERQQEIDALHTEFTTVRNAYLVEFSGLRVDQVNDLRRKIRGTSGRYRVVKNRLAIRASEGTVLSGQDVMFDGPTALFTQAMERPDTAAVLTREPRLLTIVAESVSPCRKSDTCAGCPFRMIFTPRLSTSLCENRLMPSSVRT